MEGIILIDWKEYYYYKIAHYAKCKLEIQYHAQKNSKEILEEIENIVLNFTSKNKLTRIEKKIGNFSGKWMKLEKMVLRIIQTQKHN